jgi:Ion transport protein
VMSIYAVLGMQLFPFVKRGKSLNEYSNFESYGRAMLLLFQVLTGDDWYMIMRDAAIDYDHGCNPDAVPSDCGTALAIPFFVSFVLIGAFIFLNLIVAVVLECYDALRAWKDASELAEQSGKPGFISTDHLIEFQELWAEYAKDNRDYEALCPSSPTHSAFAARRTRAKSSATPRSISTRHRGSVLPHD